MIVLGVGAVLVSGWLATRVIFKVQEKSQIEAERKSSASVGDKVPEVRVATPTAGLWLPSVPLEGTIEAAQRAQLAFKVGGRLSFVGVRLGDTVKAGQLLGRLDANEASAQRSAAAAQLDAARAQFFLAEDAQKRTSQLVSGGALAEANGVQADQQKALAEAQAAAAKAQLGLASSSLANHALVAPFSGTVTKAPNTQGAVVGPGEPLFELVDDSVLRLRGSVTEEDARLVTEGARVEIRSPAGTAIARIRTVLGVLDSRTRRVPVEADLEPKSDVRVGSFVVAEVKQEKPIDILKIPGESLRPGSQNTVLIVHGDTLEERQIAFAVDPETGSLFVRSGIAISDVLVLSPRPEARTGDKVRVKVDAPSPLTSSAAKGKAP